MNASLFEQFFVKQFGPDDAEILFVNDEPRIAVIFLQDDNSSFIEGLFSPNQELDRVFVTKLWNHPLNPDTIVFFLELELLHSLHIKIFYVLILQDIFSFYY